MQLHRSSRAHGLKIHKRTREGRVRAKKRTRAKSGKEKIACLALPLLFSRQSVRVQLSPLRLCSRARNTQIHTHTLTVAGVRVIPAFYLESLSSRHAAVNDLTCALFSLPLFVSLCFLLCVALREIGARVRANALCRRRIYTRVARRGRIALGVRGIAGGGGWQRT